MIEKIFDILKIIIRMILFYFLNFRVIKAFDSESDIISVHIFVIMLLCY